MSAQPKCFDIGLAMAGAASAGSYTAGVLDFLLEALAEWEAARQAGDDTVPTYTVRIRVAAGASAGGISAALLGMLPFVGHTPMRDLVEAPTPASARGADANLLYRTWVLGADLAEMLSIGDLQSQPRGIPSLLNGQPLARIAASAAAETREATLRTASPALRYLANPLQLILTMTNMDGVPFTIAMSAVEGLCGHRVRCHADYAHFAVLGAGAGPAGPLPAGAIVVNDADEANDDGRAWRRLADAALATSAFPGGFPARRFVNERVTYFHRPWLDGTAETCSDDGVRLELSAAGTDDVAFWSMDGGLLDNEPIEHVRRTLYTGQADDVGQACAETRDGRRADRAILLIDPFPNADAAGPGARPEEPDIISSLASLLPILREQVSFRPNDLVLALCEGVASRFMLAPVRDNCPAGETALAAAGLSGFAGFINGRLRLHDFQLGRRNCQKFLRDHFLLPASNPLFAPGRDGNEARRPIIPLVGTAALDVPLPRWPQLDARADVAPLEKLIAGRVNRIMPNLLRALMTRLNVADGRLIARVVKSIASKIITDRAAAAAYAAIEQDLAARGLIFPEA